MSTKYLPKMLVALGITPFNLDGILTYSWGTFRIFQLFIAFFHYFHISLNSFEHFIERNRANEAGLCLPELLPCNYYPVLS